jgi:nitrate reductase beta subunit
MEACPYKKTHYRGTTRTTEKCIGCFPRVEGKDQASQGVPMQTRCMSSCIGHIRLQGLIELNKDGAWKENRYNPLYYLIHVAKVALPLYPQFGTSPMDITFRRAGSRAPILSRCSVGRGCRH